MDTIKTAQVLALPLSFSLAGYAFNSSQNALPPLYTQPARISTPIFSRVFHSGAFVVLPSSLISAAASAYLAYALPDQRLLWGGAGLATVAPGAYTGIVMLPDIRRLLAVSESEVEQEKVERSGEHVGLLKMWVVHNYVRAGMYFVGAMCGLVAVVGV